MQSDNIEKDVDVEIKAVDTPEIGANAVMEKDPVSDDKEMPNSPDKAENVSKDIGADAADKVGRAALKDKKRGVPEQSGEEPAAEKISQEKAMRILEAIMFANGDEVYFDQFAKIIGYPLKEAVKIVDAYEKLYSADHFPRGIRFVRYDKCCQLTTCPELGDYVTQMIGIRGEPQLSAAAMETLAIIAYNQPVTRAYVEQVRRVDSTRPITVLLDRELIEERGRLDVIGRPRLFGTTQNFLRTFGISSLAELPSLDLFNIDT